MDTHTLLKKKIVMMCVHAYVSYVFDQEPSQQQVFLPWLVSTTEYIFMTWKQKRFTTGQSSFIYTYICIIVPTHSQ